jgi:hypothetical protein
MSDEFNQRFSPSSNLEAEFLTTNPSWFRENTEELDKVLQRKKRGGRRVVQLGFDGKVVIPVETLKAQLSFYNRDFRLGNLKDEEVEYCSHYTDLAGDSLSMKFPKAFSLSLQRTATRLELSQSRKGFFRRQGNTLTSENISQQLEPKKRGLFGQHKERREY